MKAALKCPYCDGKTFTDYGDGLIACQRCYTQFDLNQQQCPHCGSLLAKDNFICLQCGTDLRGDLAQRIIKERLMTPNDRRRVRLSMAQQARAQEKKASSQRLEAWWETEREWQKAEYQQQAARQRHERNVLIVAVAVTIVIILLIALVSLLLLSSTQPDPTATTRLLQQGIGG